MSETFEQLKKNLESCKCQDCGGTGNQNDADLGDMYYKEWKCKSCKGTGINGTN